MTHAKRTKPKAAKRTPAPRRTAPAERQARQPTLPGVPARKVSPKHFALYLTEKQRELVHQVAAHISTPWSTASQNAAIRAAFLEGAKTILARKPGENSAKAGEVDD